MRTFINLNWPKKEQLISLAVIKVDFVQGWKSCALQSESDDDPLPLTISSDMFHSVLPWMGLTLTDAIFGIWLCSCTACFN